MFVTKYTEKEKGCWNEAVSHAVNGTFLFNRNYMDYHADRFEDASLLFSDSKGRIKGLLPANIRKADSQIVVESHGGLTYGGFLFPKEVSSQEVGEMFALARNYYASREQASRLIYKAIPPIYFKMSALQDRYWLFRRKARRIACGLSTVITKKHALAFSTLRKRMAKKAGREGLSVCEATSEADWKAAWQILTEVLAERHHVSPTHSLSEICLLEKKFPDEIHLHVACRETEILAMCVVYQTACTAHAQYIAASENGRAAGALDLLFSEIIKDYFEKGCDYFDFGISTEKGGRILNDGLLFQKEGFGGRGICYDTYELDLTLHDDTIS